jgi:uncharacterized protein (UPF0332 family)
MRTPQVLTDEKRKILIEMRLEKAHQASSDAQFAMSDERLHNAVNRIYYAMFFMPPPLLHCKTVSAPRSTSNCMVGSISSTLRQNC